MKTLKRLLSLLLCMILVLSFFPAAYAEGEGSIAPVEEADAPAGADAPGGPKDGADTLPVVDEAQGETDSGSCGENLTWTLEDGVLTISGTGAMMDWTNYWDTPWYRYRDVITGISLPEGLTSIGRFAFCDCNALTGVTIPESVTSIGYGAFGTCSALESVTIPPHVTSIGEVAFRFCTSLTDVTIPASVTEIGAAPFSRCESLTEIRVEEGNGSFIARDGVLYDKEMRRLIQCPAGWRGEFAIPAGVTEIGDEAFGSCRALTGVSIPEGVERIGIAAFDGCTALTGITIPASVTSIDEASFSGCLSMTEIRVAEGNGSFASRDGVLYDKEMRRLLQCPAGRSVELTIPKGVESIGSYACANCRALTGVSIPEGVVSIEKAAFLRCVRLERVTFPGSVASIESIAFDSCSGLREIIFLGSAPAINSFSFWDVTATVYYPEDGSWTEDVRQDYRGTLTWVVGASTLSFDPNGGSVSLPAKTVMYGGTYGELPTPNWPARRFLGWYTAPEGGTLVTEETSVETTADHTLYAHWEDATAGELKLEDVSGRPGQEILVPVSLSSNPGLYLIHFHVNYDSSMFQLIGAEEGSLKGWICETGSGYLHWDAPEDHDESAAGVVVRLRFWILEDAPDGAAEITLDNVQVLNRDEEEFYFRLLPGTVTVSSRIAGDVNGDGEVNILDLIRLRKYLMGAAQDIQSANADVTGDGVVDNKDLVRLRKYLAGDPYTVLD